MKNWLHITNGDGAADLIKDSVVEGDVLPWRDVMHHGPFPGNNTLEELAKIRADYLSGDVLNREEVQVGFNLRDAHFSGAARYDEIILWFEHDLLDQLQLIQILDLIKKQELDQETDVSLICIGEYPGIDPFRGLGQLTLEQAAGLINERKPVCQEQYELASKTWQAFGKNNPDSLSDLMSQNSFACLPFLKPCLEQQWEEFPHANDHLTRTERQFLKLAEKGVSDPVRLFIDNMDLERWLFMGDWQSFVILDRLCNAPKPLLTCKPSPFRYPPKDEIEIKDFRAQDMVLTEHGKRVLNGEVKSGLVRDEWFGGIHIRGQVPSWQWDSENRVLIASGSLHD